MPVGKMCWWGSLNLKGGKLKRKSQVHDKHTSLHSVEEAQILGIELAKTTTPLLRKHTTETASSGKAIQAITRN